MRQFRSFGEFYPFYLGEHRHRISRRLHFIGTSLVIATAFYAVVAQRWTLFWLLPLFGYSFAWAGHFFFERNKPATFKHPFYSLAADFVMFKDILLRRIPF